MTTKILSSREKLEKTLERTESEQKTLKQKYFKVRDFLWNWKQIDPVEISDAQNRINILTGKKPWNKVFTYQDVFTSQYFELTQKVGEAYTKILKETKEIEPRENKNFREALKYNTKFHERGMKAKEMEYLERTSMEEIVEDIKSGKIENENI